MQKLEVGDIVESLAGHDKGKLHLIVSLDESYAEIVDGKLRKLEAPKKKKLKHLKFICKQDKYEALTDKKIRELLKKLLRA